MTVIYIILPPASCAEVLDEILLNLVQKIHTNLKEYILNSCQANIVSFAMYRALYFFAHFTLKNSIKMGCVPVMFVGQFQVF